MKSPSIYIICLSIIAVVMPFGVRGQFKTGIKTHHPGSSSGSLVLGNATESPTYQYNQYNVTHVIATSGGGAATPVFIDPTAEFINKTRSAMSSGICYKEVPTATLVANRALVPAGNGTTSSMSKIQVCCDGYQRNPHVFTRCDPICKDDCRYGICTAPNTCVCIPGHVRDYEDKCIATCPIGCGNGLCEPDGSCKCKPGYIIEPIRKQYCIPHCAKGCDFGVCTGPDQCECSHGYQLNDGGICEPKCDNCAHGSCVAPGVCNCDRGYVQKEGFCEPICTHGCDKGTCIAPDVCSCRPGFELDRSGSSCVPHCDQPCLNGYCDGNNVCACNNGYIQDEYQSNVCKPHCPKGCPNGYCTSPNFCICRPGFIKSGIKGRQQCVPV